MELENTIQTNKRMSLENFSLITVLGKGAYAKVILVKDKKT